MSIFSVHAICNFIFHEWSCNLVIAFEILQWQNASTIQQLFQKDVIVIIFVSIIT